MKQEITDAWNALQKTTGNILHPIKDEEHYNQVIALLDEILEVTRDEPDDPMMGFLEIVTLLVAEYEKQYPIELSEPHEILDWFMRITYVTQLELMAATGIDQSMISKHLQNKRPISKRDARAYAAYFKTDVTAFLESVGT